MARGHVLATLTMAFLFCSLRGFVTGQNWSRLNDSANLDDTCLAAFHMVFCESSVDLREDYTPHQVASDKSEAQGLERRSAL